MYAYTCLYIYYTFIYFVVYLFIYMYAYICFLSCFSNLVVLISFLLYFLLLFLSIFYHVIFEPNLSSPIIYHFSVSYFILSLLILFHSMLIPLIPTYSFLSYSHPTCVGQHLLGILGTFKINCSNGNSYDSLRNGRVKEYCKCSYLFFFSSIFDWLSRECS